jgi:DNA-binding FadR family transcriptional regulator
LSTTEKRKNRKIAESIARDIVSGIVTRDLQPGTLLPSEADMVSSYGVGRATLREALRILEVQGVITVRPGPRGGPVVAGVTARDFADPMSLHLQTARATYAEVFEARLAIEPLMTRLAAETRAPAAIERLKATIEHEASTDLADDVAFQDLSLEFHLTLAGISGSRVLDLLGQSLKIVYDTGIRPSSVPVKQRAQVRAAHREIAEAIIEGRADDAERLTRSLLLEYRKATRRNRPGLLDEQVEWL